MQRTHKLVGIVVRGARWGLPWMCVLALSAGLASAMTLAVAPAPAEPEPQPSMLIASSLGGPFIWADSSLVGYAQLARSNSSKSCDTSGGRLLYVGLNTWIPTDPQVGPCPP